MLEARAKEFGLDEGEIKECAFCHRLVWWRDSFAPNDELLCSVCDTELTGRKHPDYVNPMVGPPPPDAYPELYAKEKDS
jgi:hypothetical protein